MNENNIYAKPKYKCAICGKVYDTIEERMKCEQSCINRKKELEKKAEAAKKKAEKETRKKELDEAIKHAAKLLEDWNKDYGFYRFIDESLTTSDALWFSKLNEFFR